MTDRINRFVIKASQNKAKKRGKYGFGPVSYKHIYHGKCDVNARRNGRDLHLNKIHRRRVS